MDLAPHLEAWQRLASDAERGRARGEWFAGPAWLLPLLETFFTAGTWSLRFLYVGEELVAMVPFVVGGPAAGKCTADLTFPINSHVRRIGILSRVPEEDMLGWLLPEVLSNSLTSSRAQCLAFRQVPNDSALDASIRIAVKQSRLVSNSFEESSSAVVEINRGWDAYAATRTREQLHPLRRGKKLQRDGGWSFRRADLADGFDAAWTSLLTVEQRSWKHKAGTSIVNEHGADSFYRSVAIACAGSGALRIHTLEHDGIPVAHTFGAVFGHTYYLLKHSFDESHRRLSPGFLLMWHVMQESVAEGCTKLDLLGDAMAWKVAVATSLPTYSSHYVFPRNNYRCQRCRLVNEVLKPAVRQLGLAKMLKRAIPKGRPVDD